MQLDYVISSTGRSGTLSIANLLTENGMPTSHEGIFTCFGINEAIKRLNSQVITNSECSKKEFISTIKTNLIKSEVSYMSAPYLDHEILSNAKIVHLIRHPVQVINSYIVNFCYFLSGNLDGLTDEWQYEYPPGADPNFLYHRFIYKHLPELTKEMDAWTRASLFYIRWNELIEKKSKNKEYLRFRIEDNCEVLLDFLGINNRIGCKNLNKGMKKQYKSFSEFPETPVKDMLGDIIRRYKYDIIKFI